MPTAPALLDCQRRFLAALYADDAPGPTEAILPNGLEPAARLRIYRRSSTETHTAALRATYPAVLALVGEAFFDQTAARYRRALPSHSGNLQAFGHRFADFLESLPATSGLPYLGDVARLEWLRQQTALADDGKTLSPDALAGWSTEADGPLAILLHPSVRLLASRYPVLTIWRYAIQPSPKQLQLGDEGENVVLWREDGEVAMAVPDAASFTCIEALVQKRVLDAANTAAQAVDAGFDLAMCMQSLLQRGLISAVHPVDDPC